ncbi:MAG: DUF4957 domain-containing protein [Paludibacter sp.]|nr:DUF4957 domain-containing protein [Paludibacter sp.]
MKKIYVLLFVLCFTNIKTLHATHVITLSPTDGIGTVLNAYSGFDESVTVIVPAGYTSIEYTGIAPSNIILSAIPSTIKHLIIKGDGTNPTLLMRGFTFPATGLVTFTVKDLTMKGIEDVSSGALSLTNYVAQSGAVVINSVIFDNCTIANFRGVIRMNSGNAFTNLTFDHCIIRNIKDYNILNTAAGSTLTNLTFKNSTVYGLNGNVFGASGNVPTTVTIADCTFDNIGFVTGKYLIDLGTANTTTALTITNTILGKTLSSGYKGIRGGTDWTYTVTNSYVTSDWVAAANPVVGFTSYSNASTILFKTPTVYDGTNTTATIGDYKLMDKSVAGNVGDPRWYNPGTGIKSVENNIYAYFTDNNLVVNNAEVGSMIFVYTFSGALIRVCL